VEQIFNEIYKNEIWMSGNPNIPRSGPGSSIEYTTPLRQAFPEVLDIFGVKTLLDAPCGDMTWMSVMLNDVDITYIGGDIVKSIVDENIRNYSNSKTFFTHLDITKDPLPNSDMMLCRDCLFHFSFEYIRKALNNFYRSGIKYLMATNHIFGLPNVDIETGDFRVLDLTQEPFLLGRPLYVVEERGEAPGVLRQVSVWTREQIGNSIFY
jgi:hypothetical protein